MAKLYRSYNGPTCNPEAGERDIVGVSWQSIAAGFDIKVAFHGRTKTCYIEMCVTDL